MSSEAHQRGHWARSNLPHEAAYDAGHDAGAKEHARDLQSQLHSRRRTELEPAKSIIIKENRGWWQVKHQALSDFREGETNMLPG